MKPTRIAGALTVVTALAVPAAASAHPSVYTENARIVKNGALEEQTRHVVTNHGFTFVLRETNGLEGTKGVIDFSRLPNPYRSTIPFSQWQTEGGTGAQPHATCEVGTLETEDAIKAWQGTDPFYNYVPFQQASAGLEDDPASWIPLVKQLTNVDLATEANPKAACEALAPGAKYWPADETQTSTASLNSGFLEHETAPLNAQIATLTTAVTAADQATAALQAALDLAKAEIVKLANAAAPMKVALPSARTKGDALAKNGATVTVTGPAGSRVSVELTVSRTQVRKLDLKSRVLASAEATIGADGTVEILLATRKSARKALKQLKRAVTLTATAVAGDRSAATTGTVTR